MIYQVKGISGYVWGVYDAPVCAGMYGCARGGAWVCGCVRGYAWVYTCVWDELSEFLPENRVPTSADFNMYPIRIFFYFKMTQFFDNFESELDYNSLKKSYMNNHIKFLSFW